MRVTVCVASSLDGKIATVRRDPVSFTSRADREHLHEQRDRADAILIGAASIRAEDPPLLPGDASREARAKASRRPLPVRAVVSGSLDLPDGRALRPELGSPVVVFTTDDPDPQAKRVLEDLGHEVVSCESGGALDLGSALRYLAETHEVETLLCEGGGEVNAAMFAADLVDTLYLTLCPVVIGGAEAPTPVDGAGFRVDELPNAKLVSCEQRGDEVFLCYTFR